MKLFGLFLIAGLAFGASSDEAPDWVRQAAAQKISSYPTKVSAVVLLSEQTMTVDPEGKRIMRERGVMKALQRGAELRAFRSYNKKSGKISNFQAWLISPDGKSFAYGKTTILDVAMSRDDTYDEYRAKAIDCGAVPPGSVFAWDVTEEEKSVFTQDAYGFQEEMPVLVSRYSVTLPAGWETTSVMFNHAPLDPQVSGNTYSWELRDLPWIEHEEHSPTMMSLAPWLAVSYFPPTDNRAGLQGLRDWTAVSTWLTPLVDPPAAVTDPIRKKATELTANAPTELDKIKAIAAFVQKTSYVEVALNLSKAGGYTPRKAEETLARNYGDCKDKATLMRALLKAVGIDSWLEVISANDRTRVRSEWASPQQFNHAIVAVKVSPEVKIPTVIDAGALGRLLIFDPTDPITPVGDLPDDEQGSHALVIAGAQGALITMPVLPPAANRIESSIAGSVDLDGQLKATVARQYYGQSSIPWRGIEMARGGAEVRKRFERVFARRLAGATVGKFDAKVNDEGMKADVELSAERFAQNMQGQLYMVRPGLLGSGGADYAFPSKARTAPVQLNADLRKDSIHLKLPAGFKPDEIPQPEKIESKYGSLNATWAVRDGEAVLDMTLEIKEVTAPASEYAQVRDFFDKVSGAQGSAIVLVKD
jgi:hypothetical protein